jgi:transposase
MYTPYTQPLPQPRYFAGLDVHLAYVSVAVVTRAGEVILEQRVDARRPEALLAALAPYHTPEVPLEAVVETCPFWPWLYELLEPAGVRMHLAHAKELRAIATSHRKTDERDAVLLARMLAAGLIPEVIARTAGERDVLTLLRHRASLVKLRTALANRVHAQLHQQRLALPRERLLRRTARAWLEETAWPQLLPEQRRLVRTHLALAGALTRLVRALDRRIAAVAAATPAAVVLQTVPGIGPYRGLLLATLLAPVERFPTPAKFVGYAGLAPRTRSSGGHTRHGPIPRSANHAVRGALVSAIATHLRAAPASALTAYYLRLKPRVGWRVARVATARRLAHVLYRMLSTGEAWREPSAVARPAPSAVASSGRGRWVSSHQRL